MIVVEKHGMQLRCTGCRAKFDLMQHADSNAVREGFAKYHTLCPLAGGVAAARAMIKARVKNAMYAQVKHRRKYGQSTTGATG